jgi:hypothetical protein
MTDQKKHANKRSDGQIERDRRFIARLYVVGYDQLQITNMVNEMVKSAYDDEVKKWTDAGDIETAKRIALPYTLTRTQIQFDIKAIKQEWRKSSTLDFDEMLGKELDRLDIYEHEYWLAWERSKKQRVLMTTSDQEVLPEFGRDGVEIVPAFSKKRKTQRVEIRIGNPAFLAGAERCAAERRRLLGLYAAITSEVGAGAVAGQAGGEPMKLVAGWNTTTLLNPPKNAEAPLPPKTA